MMQYSATLNTFITWPTREHREEYVVACAQERGCYVFAFSGPQEVRELELGTDMASVNNLLGFLEKVLRPTGPRYCNTAGAMACSRMTLESCSSSESALGVP